MNWGLITTGFIFGTFKFLFAHWTTYAAFNSVESGLIIQIFASVTTGAIISMATFYFLSDYMMERAATKRANARAVSLELGAEYVPPKKFTRLNKFMVKMKMSFGIYGITLLAPLFLSIPLGSIVCAKFYGDQKKTFPLMLLFTTSYSTLMCALIYLVN